MSAKLHVSETAADDGLQLGHTELSLPECFEHKVRIHRSRRAIGSGNWQPNYDELNNAANHVAHGILPRGAVGDRVAVMMRQDGGAIVAAVLGVLKAGRIVLVLNPADPPDRQVQMIADAEPSLVVADKFSLERAGQICGNNLIPVCFEDLFATSPSPNPGIYASADEVAILTYTSGSTGRPKGVMGTHRTVLHHVYRCSRIMKICPDDRIAALSSLGSGQGLGLTWCALFNGAAALPFPISADDLTGLASWVMENQTTILASATSVLRHLMQTRSHGDGFPCVRLVRIGSEATSGDDLAAFRQCFSRDCVLMHAYSTTESGNVAQHGFHRSEDVAAGLLPAGRPVEGIEVLVMDEGNRELPRGEAGEIIVKSRYLSPGYWRDEAHTKERFSESGDGMCRFYRTGDRGWLAPGGQLVVMGRKSGHVNIHGHSIELSEIESTLLRQRDVAGAVVLTDSSTSGKVQVVAFVTLRNSSAINSFELREALRRFLPWHMIPASILILASFPLTPAGKPDRQKLFQTLSESRAMASREEKAPATETEDLLAAIWAGVLNKDRVPCDADFFELGGDSLVAVAIVAKVHSILGVELDMRAFASCPTVTTMSRLVDTLRESALQVDHVPLIRVSRDEPLQASLSQERIWRYSQTPEGAAGYTKTAIDQITGPLDLDALKKSLNELVLRHEILRSGFIQVDGKLFQVVQPAPSSSLCVTDLVDAVDPEMAAQEEVSRGKLVPFDLETGPLFRLHLLRLGKDVHWLVRACHYIIMDGGSWRVFFTELMALYRLYLRGETPTPLSQEHLQFADFAAWQRRRFEAGSPDHVKEINWWRETMQGVSSSVSPPFLRPVPEPEARAAEGKIAWNLDEDVTSQLDALGRKAGATHYSTRLALFSAYLSLKSGEPNVVLATYATNRARTELQHMLGCFVNLAILRLHFEGRHGFLEWLPQVSRIVADAQAHAAIPYEILREDLSREDVFLPEVKMIFGLSDEKPTERTAGLEISRVPRQKGAEAMPWGFTTSLQPLDKANSWRTSFDARIYDPAAVHESIGQMQLLAAAVCREPERPLAELAQLWTSGNSNAVGDLKVPEFAEHPVP